MAQTERPQYGCYVEWSDDDKEFVATCLDLPGLSGLGATIPEAIQELEDALGAWLEAADQSEIPPPNLPGNLVVIDRSRFREDDLVIFRQDIVDEETSNESVGETANVTRLVA